MDFPPLDTKVRRHMIAQEIARPYLSSCAKVIVTFKKQRIEIELIPHDKFQVEGTHVIVLPKEDY